MFPSNRVNNLFTNTKKIPRLNFKSTYNEKSFKKKSLRGFIEKKRIPAENLTSLGKVRQSLRAGL